MTNDTPPPSSHKKRRRIHSDKRTWDRLCARLWRRLDRLPLELLLDASVVIITVGAVLAIGAVHPPVMVALAVVATIALSLSILVRGRTEERPRFPWPAWIFWGLAGYTLLQLIPLPMSWLAIVAPSNADIWARSLMPLGEAGPGLAPISLDPGASWMEVLRWFSYGAVMVSMATVASRRGLRWGAMLLFITALIAAVTTLSHGLLGMDKVFGLYTPTFKPAPWHLGPLLNPNNLAGLLNLGTLCGLGMLLSTNAQTPRWMIAVGVTLIVGVAITCASRSGVLMLLFGVLVLAITNRIQQRRKLGDNVGVHRSVIIIGGALALGLVLAVLGGTHRIADELLSENMRKLEIISLVLPVIDDFTWLGVGRGAFESVFPAYQQADGGIVFTHAENFVAHWVVEWGVIVAATGLFAFGFALRRSRLDVTRNTVAAGVWTGIVVVAIQNFADLGMEVPGLVFALTAAFGALWGGSQRTREETVSEPWPAPRVLSLAAAALATGTLCCATAVARDGLRDIASDRIALRDQILDGSTPSAAKRAVLHTRLREAMLRHPAEPYFAIAGALLAFQYKQGVMPWLQRALERAPVSGKAHLMLARLLMDLGARNQALMELRLSMKHDVRMVGQATQLGARYAHNFDELKRLIPRGERAADAWASLGGAVADRDLAAQCDDKALAVNPKRVWPRFRLGNDMVTARRNETGCADGEERDHCAAEIAAHVAAIANEKPRSSMAPRLQARWLAALGQHDEGEKLLASACEEADDYIPCLQARLEVAVELDAERFGAAAKALRVNACVEPARCAEINTLIGNMHVARGEFGQAVAVYQRAVRDDATQERWKKLADAAHQAGMDSQAIRALDQLRRLRGGDDPALDEQIKRQRQKIVDQILKR